MNKLIKLLFFLLAIAFCGCGTGPWYIQKNLYNLYKTPIYQVADLQLKTNGYYSLISDSTQLTYFNRYLVFNNKGYCVFLDEKELENLMVSSKPIFKELNWWKVKNDSIIIEHYGETKRLIKTLVYWHRGKILSDSIIGIGYQENNYIMKPLKYRFIQNKQIPELINDSRYLKKDWYTANLNEQRR